MPARLTCRIGSLPGAVNVSVRRGSLFDRGAKLLAVHLAALIAERSAFKSVSEMVRAKLATSGKAVDVNRRLAQGAANPGGDMTAAYKSVIRLHLPSYFFAFAGF